MDIYPMKNFCYACLVVAVLCGCSSGPKAEMVSQEMYNERIAEYKSLNEQQAAIISDNMEKSKTISNVVNELRQLTNATTQLRQNVELGQGQVSQAEEIRQRLDLLKKRLQKEQKSSRFDDNKELLATIGNLQAIIVQKEEEISGLRQQIEQKDRTIESQKITIEQQSQQLLENQRETWFMLGKELREVAKELPKVKGRKDKRNMKNTRYYILNKSKECFDQAVQLGHSTASTFSREVGQEMENL